MPGNGGANSAKYRDEVHAGANAGDVARTFLCDSIQDDRLEGADNSERLLQDLYFALTNNAQHGQPMRSAKGADVKHDRAVDLILTIESPGKKSR